MKRTFLTILLMMICFNLIAEDIKPPDWDIGDFYKIINRARMEHGLKPLMRFLPLQYIAKQESKTCAKIETVGYWFSKKATMQVLEDKFKTKVFNLNYYTLKEANIFKRTPEDLLAPAFEQIAGNPIFFKDINAMGISIHMKGLFYYITIVLGRI